MSNVFGISVSALQAFQQAINVASNNVANANTPGYDRETVNLTEAIPQANGAATVGSGVAIAGISRAYSQAAANQLTTSQSNLGQLTTLQNYSSQIDNLFGTTIGGLSTSLQTYYSAWSDVANNPTSTASRQALLSSAQGVASSFQNASAELDGLNADVNSHITEDVTQINSLSATISTLNSQIVIGTAQNGTQPPNELMDQRDQAVSDLSKLVGVSTTKEANGALNVFIGNGQPLVLQGVTMQLKTVPNQFNASQLEIATGTGSASISSTVTSGDLGGLLAARSQVIQPALNQLGQVAAALSATSNAQQAQGIDLNGHSGAPLFQVGGPVVTSSAKNTDATTASATLSDDVGALTANDYVLSYQGGAYTVTNAGDGSSVAFSGTGTAADPIVVGGVAITLSGTPANGDQFSIRPTQAAAAGFRAVLTDPTQVAAAGALQGSAASTNTGSGSISPGSVVDPTDPDLATPASIVFSTPTTYSVDGGAAQTYVAGGNIDVHGWQVQISGAPATGDTFTLGSNAGGTGDNRNALAAANLQNTGVLANGATSITGAVSALITGIGSQAQQISTAQQAQTAVNTQAQAQVQSVSGVNLDEEAASLLQWQQAYQAAAQALNIGNSLFASLLSAVNQG